MWQLNNFHVDFVDIIWSSLVVQAVRNVRKPVSRAGTTRDGVQTPAGFGSALPLPESAYRVPTPKVRTDSAM